MEQGWSYFKSFKHRNTSNWTPVSTAKTLAIYFSIYFLSKAKIGFCVFSKTFYFLLGKYVTNLWNMKWKKSDPADLALHFHVVLHPWFQFLQTPLFFLFLSLL